jgi:hypothetical protein
MNPDGLHRGSVFAVGTGRCGTHLLAELFGSEPAVSASHESNPFSESFQRYCQWYGLPVDDSGFLAIKRREMESAWLAGKSFFEASAYLSLSVEKIFCAFGSRFILITRNPVDTVNSLWVKGWYQTDYQKQDGASALGYHAIGQPHHFFSRLTPRGDEFQRWQSLSRIGKLGWFWSALHRSILDQMERLPETNRTLVKVEELNYESYLQLAQFAGVESCLSRQLFGEVAGAKPGSLPARHELGEWSRQELQEFTPEVTEVAALLGYPTDFHAQWSGAQRTECNPRYASTEAPAERSYASARLPGATLALTVGASPSSAANRSSARDRRIDWFRFSLDSISEDAAELIDAAAGVHILLDPSRTPRALNVRKWNAASVHLLVDAERPGDVTAAARRFEADGVAVIGRLATPLSLLNWNEILAEAPAVAISAPALSAAIAPRDLYQWLLRHYEDALRLSKPLAVLVNLGEDSLHVFAWMLRVGMMVCVADSDDSPRWQERIDRLIALVTGSGRAAPGEAKTVWP